MSINSPTVTSKKKILFWKIEPFNFDEIPHFVEEYCKKGLIKEKNGENLFYKPEFSWELDPFRAYPIGYYFMQPDTMNLAYESAFVISPERFYSEYELTDENYEQESFSRKNFFI
ncbi:hypothetical protein [Lactococcus fujiensis]|uniref:Uncharacterized protein n=1 Tax=Lactococcus fujiensis JCM 16395 TaxID=1291764 RepID=A0A2A5RHW9_9LACT|nr:hypothetical protein [Lactococcus fujiensis]PCR98666.1 hypothetical protein RT41_GL001383 [Lactococcus fujiensis JCM 16395]